MVTDKRDSLDFDLTETDIEDMKVADLRKSLAALEFPQTGRKVELKSRL